MKVWLSMFFVFVLASVAGANGTFPAPYEGLYTVGFESPDAVWNNDRWEVPENSTITVEVRSNIIIATGFALGALTVDNSDGGVTNEGVTVPLTVPPTPPGVLHPGLMFLVAQPGTLVNDGNALKIVIKQISGSAATDDPTTPTVDESRGAWPSDPEAIYTFEIDTGAAGTTIDVDDYIGNNPNFPPPPPVFSTSVLWFYPGGGENPDYDPTCVENCEPEFLAPASGSFDLGGDGLDLLGLHVVPEPATIALLGLGTLVFLRKRNK